MKRLQKLCRRTLGACIAGALFIAELGIVPRAATPVEAAGKTPISSVEDLRNMEKNPSGSYYLTRDIKLPKNMENLFTFPNAFKGTLDGRGHKLKGFTRYAEGGDGNNICRVALFDRAFGATFKNLTLSNVDIRVNIDEGRAYVSTLVDYSNECNFSKVKVTGKITVKGNNKDEHGMCCEIGGITKDAEYGSFTDCSSSLKITVSCGNLFGLQVGGIAGGLSCNYDKGIKMKNCTFSGSIDASCKETKPGGSDHGGFVAGGLCGTMGEPTLTGCVNSGDITLKVAKGPTDRLDNDINIGAAGLGNGEAAVYNCGNSGNIKVYAPELDNTVRAVGLVPLVTRPPVNSKIKNYLEKCWNTGKISAFSGAAAHAAGLSADTGYISQCYNKGEIYAKGQKKSDYNNLVSTAAGLSLEATRVINSYNVGNITAEGSGSAGGLACHVEVMETCTCSYSTGKVKAHSVNGNDCAAALYGCGGVKMVMENKTFCYDNYYTSGYPYGDGGDGGHHGLARQLATKVSSITSRSCPKLSSKYWTYSSGLKRMVLKNNLEK